MLSKRDKLLLRPWQERRFNNHRKKVQSALPAIDNNPPFRRDHVETKLKKNQKENERCAKIERDNLILLQKLCDIMKKNRLDNSWEIALPNFLNRVAIYDKKPQTQKTSSAAMKPELQQTTRKLRCFACNPRRSTEPPIPEQRVPWEPEKPPVSLRVRSKSVPVRKQPSLPTLIETSEVPKSAPPSSESRKLKKLRNNCSESPQSIILMRGSLKLSVNFPSDTYVKFQTGTSEKLLMPGLCYCKNAIKTTQ